MFRHIYDHCSARRAGEERAGGEALGISLGSTRPGPISNSASPLRWPPSLPLTWEFSYLSLEGVRVVVLCRGGWPGRRRALGKPAGVGKNKGAADAGERSPTAHLSPRLGSALGSLISVTGPCDVGVLTLPPTVGDTEAQGL